MQGQMAVRMKEVVELGTRAGKAYYLEGMKC